MRSERRPRFTRALRRVSARGLDEKISSGASKIARDTPAEIPAVIPCGNSPPILGYKAVESGNGYTVVQYDLVYLATQQ